LKKKNRDNKTLSIFTCDHFKNSEIILPGVKIAAKFWFKRKQKEKNTLFILLTKAIKILVR
jgi:hypothetical protein